MFVTEKHFLSACQLVSAAVAARDVKPVLRNIKAIVDEDRCTLMATDLELGIRLEVRGIKVEEAGEALLPTSRLIAILREATDEEMVVEAGPDKSSCVATPTNSTCRARTRRRSRTCRRLPRRSITS